LIDFPFDTILPPTIVQSSASLTLSALRKLHSLQVWKVLAREQKPEGSALPRSSLNVAVGFECDDHLVNRRRADAKVPLHLGLGRRTTVDFAVVVNEGEILALFMRERFRMHE